MYQLFLNPSHKRTSILEDIELAIEDEATIEFSELVGPNSIEFDLDIDSHVERRIAQFHEALYTSIIGEFQNV